MVIRISWPTLLGILFIVLKLTGTVAWSWWWVLAPFWIPAAIAALVLVPLALWGLLSE